jgi:hypothetical protein
MGFLIPHPTRSVGNASWSQRLISHISQRCQFFPDLLGDLAFNDLPINRDLDPSTVTLSPIFARCFAGIQYLQQHGHGFSLHAGGTMFTYWAEVDAEGFSNLPLYISPAILLKGIGTLDEHHVNVAVIFKAESLAALSVSPI